ncbi:MAG: hypothetical protein ITD38_05160 [Nitrosospira sp.]|nr:hypothetical protein [Nitrosospira sp.]
MKRGLSTILTIAVMLASAAAQAQSREWNFQVFLDDKPIGHHHYTLRENGPERELKTEARLNVKFLFVNAYRYVHDASERWRGNCLARLTAHTDDNGDLSEVGAEQQGERVALTLSAPHGRETVDGCLMTYAYWNADILRQKRLLNTQTGKVESVTIAALGEDKIIVRNTPMVAQRYRISGGKHSIELWYGADVTNSTNHAWLALQSTLDNGRKLRYQLK